MGGHDTLYGGSGIDHLTGGSGNDTLYGGLGTGDTAYYSGPFNSYTINKDVGSIAITDNRSSGDGTDTLYDIEKLKFSDGLKLVSELSNFGSSSEMTGFSTFTPDYYSMDQMHPDIKYIANGSKWDFISSNNQVISWAISDNGSFQWSNKDKYRDKINNALEEFEKTTNLKFQYLDAYNSLEAADAGGADFIFSVDDITAPASAFFPDKQYGGLNGGRIIWFDIDTIGWLDNNNISTGWLTETVIHEIGHAIGLKHPHDSGSLGNPYTTGTRENPESHISNEDTVMTYYNPSQQQLGINNAFYATTPMYLDALYMNDVIYGKPTFTGHVGNTTHTITSSNTYSLIVDPSGNDTIDLSQTTDWNTGWHVTLTAQNSDLFEAKLNKPDNPNSPFIQKVKGIGSFENAIGSNNNDKIIGSAVKNVIKGGKGNDEVVSMGGE